MSSWWIFSYLGANWSLVLVFVFVILVLGAVAFFARNWKAAVAAAAIAGCGFAYQWIDRNAYERRVAEEHAAEVKSLTARLEAVNGANTRDVNRAIADRDSMTRLEDQARDTPANAAIALPRAAAQRVRDVR